MGNGLQSWTGQGDDRAEELILWVVVSDQNPLPCPGVFPGCRCRHRARTLPVPISLSLGRASFFGYRRVTPQS